MNSNIEDLQKQLKLAVAFERAYGEHLTGGYLFVNSYSLGLDLNKEDAVEAGKVFGQDGWIRKPGYDNTFNWEKKVDGVLITISRAEPNEFINSPINPKDFPIMLEESAPA